MVKRLLEILKSIKPLYKTGFKALLGKKIKLTKDNFITNGYVAVDKNITKNISTDNVLDICMVHGKNTVLRNKLDIITNLVDFDVKKEYTKLVFEEEKIKYTKYDYTKNILSIISNKLNLAYNTSSGLVLGLDNEGEVKFISVAINDAYANKDKFKEEFENDLTVDDMIAKIQIKKKEAEKEKLMIDENIIAALAKYMTTRRIEGYELGIHYIRKNLVENKNNILHDKFIVTYVEENGVKTKKYTVCQTMFGGSGIMQRKAALKFLKILENREEFEKYVGLAEKLIEEQKREKEKFIENIEKRREIMNKLEERFKLVSDEINLELTKLLTTCDEWKVNDKMGVEIKLNKNEYLIITTSGEIIKQTYECVNWEENLIEEKVIEKDDDIEYIVCKALELMKESIKNALTRRVIKEKINKSKIIARTNKGVYLQILDRCAGVIKRGRVYGVLGYYGNIIEGLVSTQNELKCNERGTKEELGVIVEFALADKEMGLTKREISKLKMTSIEKIQDFEASLVNEKEINYLVELIDTDYKKEAVSVMNYVNALEAGTLEQKEKVLEYMFKNENIEVINFEGDKDYLSEVIDDYSSDLRLEIDNIIINLAERYMEKNIINDSTKFIFDYAITELYDFPIKIETLLQIVDFKLNNKSPEYDSFFEGDIYPEIRWDKIKAYEDNGFIVEFNKENKEVFIYNPLEQLEGQCDLFSTIQEATSKKCEIEENKEEQDKKEELEKIKVNLSTIKKESSVKVIRNLDIQVVGDFVEITTASSEILRINAEYDLYKFNRIDNTEQCILKNSNINDIFKKCIDLLKDDITITEQKLRTREKIKEMLEKNITLLAKKDGDYFFVDYDFDSIYRIDKVKDYMLYREEWFGNKNAMINYIVNEYDAIAVIDINKEKTNEQTINKKHFLKIDDLLEEYKEVIQGEITSFVSSMSEVVVTYENWLGNKISTENVIDVLNELVKNNQDYINKEIIDKGLTYFFRLDKIEYILKLKKTFDDKLDMIINLYNENKLNKIESIKYLSRLYKYTNIETRKQKIEKEIKRIRGDYL